MAVLLVLDTGLRLSELLDLRTGHRLRQPDSQGASARARRSGWCRSRPSFGSGCIGCEQLKAKKGIRSELVFAGFRRHPVGEAQQHDVSAPAAEEAGTPHFGWHRLRHTFATNYLRQGGDIVRLSMVLGHTQITTTQRYLHLLTEDLSASHQKVSIFESVGVRRGPFCHSGDATPKAVVA